MKIELSQKHIDLFFSSIVMYVMYIWIVVYQNHITDLAYDLSIKYHSNQIKTERPELYISHIDKDFSLRESLAKLTGPYDYRMINCADLYSNSDCASLTKEEVLVQKEAMKSNFKRNIMRLYLDPSVTKLGFYKERASVFSRHTSSYFYKYGDLDSDDYNDWFKYIRGIISWPKVFKPSDASHARSHTELKNILERNIMLNSKVYGRSVEEELKTWRPGFFIESHNKFRSYQRHPFVGVDGIHRKKIDRERYMVLGLFNLVYIVITLSFLLVYILRKRISGVFIRILNPIFKMFGLIKKAILVDFIMWAKLSRIASISEKLFIKEVRFNTRIEDRTNEYLEILAVAALFEISRAKRLSTHDVAWVIYNLKSTNKLTKSFHLPLDPASRVVISESISNFYDYYNSERIDVKNIVQALDSALRKWNEHNKDLKDEINSMFGGFDKGKDEK